MIYGIQASKDIKLSSITRSLNEPIPLIKTEDRLSRNLDDKDFTEEINGQICRLGSKNVLDDMVIAIDPGDIRTMPKTENCRSLLGAENLADFLVLCVHHRSAAGQAFLVKDSEDHSTRDLITRLAQFLVRPVRLVPIPELLIRLAARLTFKEEAANRVLGSLVIDSRRAQQDLKWSPPVALDDGLAATARWFRELTLAERSKVS